jgi:excinuclease UvrABC ATPase subunit
VGSHPPRGNALDAIVIKGAREHNLKNIDLTLPRNRLIVITGLSGSGKSSLAFDTIYAEGQRRYVESLSSYARQFLGQMEKPDVDYIEGLSPAISIDQKSTSRNPRSTVGTVTEIYDYLRLLFARIGVPHCYQCGREISAQIERADRRPDHGVARGHAHPAAGAGHSRPQGRVRQAVRGDRQGGLRARADRRRDPRAA